MRSSPGTGVSYWSERLRRDPAFRERVNARNRAWYAKNKEHARARRAEWRAASPGPYKVSEMRKDARERGLEWSLPSALAEDLVTDNCFYCGAEPGPTNGIDRVDNVRGYVEDNVVSCCARCNTAKLNQPLGEFTAWLRRAAAHVERHGIVAIHI